MKERSLTPWSSVTVIKAEGSINIFWLLEIITVQQLCLFPVIILGIYFILLNM
jgi:hypothetical protein